MDRKEKILKLYYNDKLKIIEIANKYNISKQYVSKIIKGDSRYDDEKIARKEYTKVSKRNYTNKKMKEIRDIKSQIDAYMKQQHIQASAELSGGSATISNRALLKWNSSAYKYNSNKNRYEFDKKVIGSYALPKYIKFQ